MTSINSGECMSCCTPDYLHLDSSNRDRSRNPLPSDYTVSLKPPSSETSTYTASRFSDPVINGLPMLMGQFDAGAGADAAVLPAGIAPPRDNDLVGCIIEIPGNLANVPNTHVITSYDASTRTISIAPDTWAVIPAAQDSFIIDCPGVNDIQPGGVVNGFAVTSQASADTTLTLESVANVKVGSVIFVEGHDPRRITAVAAGNIITVSESWGSPISQNTPYYIRTSNNSPNAVGIFSAVGADATTTFRLAVTESSTDDFYKNSYIMVIDRDANGLLPTLGTEVAAHGEIRRIASYDGTTKEVVVDVPFSSAVTTLYGYRIWVASEQAGSVRSSRLYDQTRKLSRCMYDLKLSQMILPNQNIIVPPTKYDGQSTMPIWNLPYLVLQVTSTSGSVPGLLSNSSVSDGALFVIGMENISNPDQPFLYLEKANKIAQTVDLSGWNTIRFQLLLPTGEPLQFVMPDNPPTEQPNRNVQISMILEFCLKYCPPSHRDVAGQVSCRNPMCSGCNFEKTGAGDLCRNCTPSLPGGLPYQVPGGRQPYRR